MYFIVNQFVEICFGLEKIIELCLVVLLSSAGDVLNNVAFEIAEIMGADVVPGLDALAVMIRRELRVHR